MSAPIPSHRVLPTLNADGTRRLIRPRLYPGPKWRARRYVAWALMATFVALPWVHVKGQPLVLFDVVHREFKLFGHTFLPTDGVLLMLLLLTIFMGVVLTTALAGRAWCGWACPQTVYMEFLFRPIERWFDARDRRQSKLRGVRRAAKTAVFFGLAALLGNSFLAYFVGVRALSVWALESPLRHPEPFVVMAVVSLLTFFDFAYFREQMCTVACPYARLQSVLLDRRSLIVGYDAARGEPRRKGKARSGAGDCIDCNACVAACPTGIDIRDGLQLECIACAQCADACDSIMERVKKPLGLIRYAAQETLETGRKGGALRGRVVAYTALLIVAVAALFVTAGGKNGAEIVLLRGVGAPFELRDGMVINHIRMKVQNREDRAARYRIALLDVPGAQLIAPENPLPVPAHEQRTTTLFVISSPELLPNGERHVRFRVDDDGGQPTELTYELLGPRTARSGAAHRTEKP
jgi:cytochrome c oxidase accessory protein FixG